MFDTELDAGQKFSGASPRHAGAGQAAGGSPSLTGALHQVFTVSNRYKKFMYHDESIRAGRLSDYSLYAPAEFFAETYTVFYEEAGRPGVTEADYGRLISSTTQREWMRSNIHDRHLAPAGTGAAGGSPAPDAAPASGGATTAERGVEPGGGTGRKSHRSGP